MSVEARIREGLGVMDLALDAAQRQKLQAHLELVAKWNRVHNLTAVREIEQMVALHLLDSLSLLPYVGAARRACDVGSGAGFPGLPLAIARPDLEVTLVDSSHKKCAFLEQARAELRLDNVRVACERVEHFKAEPRYDLVVSRAFAELQDFVSQASHLLAPGGRMLAMKGIYPHDEIARLPATHRAVEVAELTVPTLDAKRHLVVLEPA